MMASTSIGQANRFGGVYRQICVDLDPGEGGVVGQVLEYDHEVGPIAILAPSVQLWLERLADEMEAGRIFVWADSSLHDEPEESET